MKLKNLRKKIDEIDDKIILLLQKRFALVQEIAKLKKREKMGIIDQRREKEVLSKVQKKAKDLKISSRFIEKLFKEIIRESIRLQNSCINELIHEIKL